MRICLGSEWMYLWENQKNQKEKKSQRWMNLLGILQRMYVLFLIEKNCLGSMVFFFFFLIISIASSIATGCWTKHYQKAQIRLSSSLFWYLDTNNYNTDISFYVEPTHIYILYILFLLSFYLQNCYQVAGNFSIKLAVKDIPVFYWKCSLITFLHTKLRVVDFKIQYNMQNGKNNQQTFHSGTSGIHGIQPNVLWRRQNLLKVA